MPRFVLLHHECPPSLGKPSHWDLMLERDSVLLTWNLLQLPIAWGGDAEAIEATRIADHRIAYLDYEGPVSGNRGIVTRVDRGEYEVLSEADDAIDVRLRGEQSQITITARLPLQQQMPPR
ncbi:DNA polymerase ligase N-terminal domain-containing protein [Lacipirellula sp.]|uniref:DNA polymerase ligase N-terminal domain-containing protein n=1 Tax=Lacipirellula sp. TaxID=2691419 RepID=UPI003D10D0ED